MGRILHYQGGPGIGNGFLRWGQRQRAEAWGGLRPQPKDVSTAMTQTGGQNQRIQEAAQQADCWTLEPGQTLEPGRWNRDAGTGTSLIFPDREPDGALRRLSDQRLPGATSNRTNPAAATPSFPPAEILFNTD